MSVVVTVVGYVLQYTLPGRRMRERGVSSSTLLLAVVVGIVGFFVIPVVGAIVGFVLGIFVVEMGRSRNGSQAWTRTKHALVAVLHSMGIELAAGLVVTAIYVVGVWRADADARRLTKGQPQCSPVVLAALPALVETVHEGALALLAAALGARVGASVAAHDAEAGPSGRGGREDGGGDHQGETPGADPHRGVDPHEHQGQTGDDAYRADHPSPPLQRGQRPTLHLRGELGVLGSESLLHLFEHLLLVL